MPATYKKEQNRMRLENPEQFVKVSSSNSMSQAMDAKRLIKERNEDARFEELEELILETSCLDPQWESLVNEYNILATKINGRI